MDKEILDEFKKTVDSRHERLGLLSKEGKLGAVGTQWQRHRDTDRLYRLALEKKLARYEDAVDVVLSACDKMKKSGRKFARDHELIRDCHHYTDEEVMAAIAALRKRRLVDFEVVVYFADENDVLESDGGNGKLLSMLRKRGIFGLHL